MTVDQLNLYCEAFVGQSIASCKRGRLQERV